MDFSMPGFVLLCICNAQSVERTGQLCLRKRNVAGFLRRGNTRLGSLLRALRAFHVDHVRILKRRCNKANLTIFNAEEAQ